MTNNTMHTIIVNSLAAAKNAYVAAKVPNSRGARSDGDSKMAKCRAYFMANPGLARKDYVKVFMDEFAATKACAETYHYNLTKELKKKAAVDFAKELIGE